LRFAFEPSICACDIGFTVSVAAITRAINATMPKTRKLINELDWMRSLVYCYRFEIALVWKHFGYLLSNAVHNTIFLLFLPYHDIPHSVLGRVKCIAFSVHYFCVELNHSMLVG